MLAIERDYEVHLIEFLVNLQPSVTKIPSCSGKYPLRRCLEQTRRRRHNREIVRMLCTCPEVVDAVDSLGRNAVQLVLEQWHGCRCLIDTTMLEILLAHSPRAAQPPDIQSKCSTSIIRTTASPIRLCYKSYKAAVADLEGWNHQIGSSTVTRRRAQQLVHLWREICLIVLRTMGDNILWGALQTSAPLSILEWILQDDPSLIRTRNAQGDLPLHWACSHLHYNGNEVFDLLIQADPGQASISGRNGMFPLHHCVQSDALLSPCRLRRLVHLYPAALSRRDPSSGLFPFQIASSGSREIGEQGLVTKHAQLDQIFSVMLMAPGLVNEAI